MPIYEFRCQDCRKRFSVFTRSVGSPLEPQCPHCGSKQCTKLVSRFATVKSEESRLEALSDPSGFSGVDENDPKSVARWARRMGQEMGEDLGPEFDEMVDRMEAGEDIDEIPGEAGGDGDDGGDIVP